MHRLKLLAQIAQIEKVQMKTQNHRRALPFPCSSYNNPTWLKDESQIVIRPS